MKNKLYEIYGIKVDKQRILGRKYGSIEFKVIQAEEQLVDSEMYVLMQSLRGGASNCLLDTDPYWQIIYNIEYKIKLFHLMNFHKKILMIDIIFVFNFKKN